MSVVMAAVPPHDRPRERLLALGAEALADRELIALVHPSHRRSPESQTFTRVARACPRVRVHPGCPESLG